MLGLVQGFGVHARLLSEENACWVVFLAMLLSI